MDQRLVDQPPPAVSVVDSTEHRHDAPPSPTVRADSKLAPNGDKYRVRRRAVLSCSKCRLRKLKCDRQNPCNQCVKSKAPHGCQYPPSGSLSATSTPYKPALASWQVSTPTRPPSDGPKPSVAAPASEGEIARWRNANVSESPRAYDLTLPRHNPPSQSQPSSQTPLQPLYHIRDQRDSHDHHKPLPPQANHHHAQPTPLSHLPLPHHLQPKQCSYALPQPLSQPQLLPLPYQSSLPLPHHPDHNPLPFNENLSSGNLSHASAIPQQIGRITAGAPKDEPLPPMYQTASARVKSLGPKNFHGNKGQARFYGRSHWALTIEFFNDISAHFNEHQKNGPIGLEYQALRAIKHRIHSREKLEILANWHLQAFRLGDLLPDRQTCDRLLQVYLATFETTFRVFHIPTLTEQIRTFWDSRQRPTADSRMNLAYAAKLITILVCVCCLDPVDAKSEQSQAEKNLVQSAQGLLYAVRSWMASTSGHNQWKTHLLQIKICMHLARQAVAFDGDLVWITSGELVRDGIVLGLHRDSRFFPRITKGEAEDRRRLWATVLELEAQASLDLGTTTSIDLDEYDCGGPLNIEDEDISHDSDTLPLPKSSSTYTRSLFQITLANSLPTRLRIIKMINSTRFDSNYDEALNLSQELMHALRDAPAGLYSDARNPPDPASPSNFSTFQISMFRLLTYRFLLALHRPFALGSGDIFDEQKFHYSSKICLELSLALLSQIPSPPRQLETQTEHYTGLLRLRGGMFRDDLLHAAMTACLLLKRQAIEIRFQALPNLSTSTSILQHHANLYRDDIVRIIDDYLEYLAWKISVEKQACRTYIIVSMALASAKSRNLTPDQPKTSIYTNTNPVHLKAVARARQDAIERCRHLLTRDYEPRVHMWEHLLSSEGEADIRPGGLTRQATRSLQPDLSAHMRSSPDAAGVAPGQRTEKDTNPPDLPMMDSDWATIDSGLSDSTLDANMDFLFLPDDLLDLEMQC